jgi:hypothetical protein
MAEEDSMKRKDDDVRDNGPRVIRITPEGRMIVDPMSIIGSARARRHLDDIANIPIRKPDPEKPVPE